MKIPCPECHRLLKQPQEKRYTKPTFRERYSLQYSKLSLYHCKGRLGCKHKFIIKQDVPVNKSLDITTTLSYDFGIWAEALKHAPDQNKYKSTVSDYTQLISQDPASIYQHLKKYHTKQVA